MATFLDIQTEVRGNIIDLPSFVTGNVPRYVNRAMRELQNKHNFVVMKAAASVSTVAGTRVLMAVPSNFKEYRGTPYVINAQGDTRELAIGISRETVEHDIPGNDGGEADPDVIIGAPRVILQSEPTADTGAANWEVWPLSDSLSLYANGQYRIRIPYWKYVVDLSGSADTNWFTVFAEEWLVRQATAMGFAADHDEDRATYWMQLAGAKYQEVLNIDKRQAISQVQNLVPYGDVWGNKNINTRAFFLR